MMSEHKPSLKGTVARRAPAGSSAQPTRRGQVSARRLRVVRRTVLMIVLIAVAVLGGLATTRLFPVTAQTEFFSASMSLSPFPEQTSTVHVPTVLGDIDIDFAGVLPAPGVEAQVQVRDEVTDLLSRQSLTVEDFRPDPVELRGTIEAALTELAWTFAAGALATTIVCSALWVLGRRHHGWGRAGLASLVATAVALGLPGAAAYFTYRAENLTEFRTTSLLGAVQARSSLLSDINGQARQAAPYVQNLLALSEAVRSEFAPAQLSETPAARFLLISDVHGMNYYPIAEEIVRSEDITAVIDTGDIVNFGRPREGEVAGIYEGIESLGVPYFFVRGNHDARFRGDEALLRRMAQVPNVVLLEPTDGAYLEATIAGVTLSGYNDYRIFNDPSDDFAADQRVVLEEFLAATEGTDPSDIVITHQPYGADRIDPGGVTVNGHMHTPTLRGPHIGVGSFTGGGLFNHFILPEDVGEETGGELPGQPYAFDILTIGEDCRVVSLTRYSYRNLVSGRPQFDDVSLINGARLDPTPPEDRSCGGDQLSVSPITPVDAVPADGE